MKPIPGNVSAMNESNFGGLPVGARFRYRGMELVKSDPLLAREQRTGRQRMIPRSAEVETLEECTAGPSDARLELGTVLDAFGAYHARCLEVLDRSVGAETDSAKAALESAREDFLRAVKS